MGHLLEYSGIVTKTRAMESRLLSPGQFQELASLHTIPEAVEYLKKNTAYAETLESLEPTQLHRGNIEKLLTQSRKWLRKIILPKKRVQTVNPM